VFLLLVVALTQVQVQAGRDSSGVSIGIRAGVAIRDTGRRIPVTAAHLATAFRDERSRTMLAGARTARFRQDSALRTYDAKVFQRVSVGMALRANARDRLLIRDEGVARVQWDQGVGGAVVDMLGKRTTFPMADENPEQVGEGVRYNLQLPIPYFPGRETLWLGGSVAQMNVDESSFVNPLAAGGEAYYRYASGDSVVYTLQSDRRIVLREMRIEAREPKWNLVVGSFWFDQATWQLVRAVYRPAVPIDVWRVANDNREPGEDAVPLIVRGLLSPFTASLEVFTVEFSLFDERFWLPVLQAAEGRVQLSMIRTPVLMEERYEYASVNGPVDVAGPLFAVVAPPPALNVRALRDTLVRAGLDRRQVDSAVRARQLARREDLGVRQRVIRDSVVRDSLTRAGMTRAAIDTLMRERAQLRADSVRAERERVCAETGRTARRFRRYEDKVDILLRVPCDLNTLLHSPELPPSALETGEDLFGAGERDRLIGALDFALQAGWGPQRVGMKWGLSQSRYNRVEGFSTGLALQQELGLGYAWSAQLRGNQGDRQFNGELGLQRTNGRVTYKLNAYRRLVSASDWGSPLSFGASLPALLYADDQGMYYRAWGGELMRETSHGNLTWRLFGEEQTNAPVSTRFSVFGGMHDDDFAANVRATRATLAGGSMHWRQSWGISPRSWRTLSDFRAEAAGGTQDYGRASLDLTVSRALFSTVGFAVTGAAGSSVGDVPAQRRWFLGGVQTIRGQSVDTAVTGNAFWFARGELARGKPAWRPSLFADIGWTGPRDSDWGRSQRLLSGVGIGASILDGMMRFDLARGLYPREQWKFNFSFEARF
jgi:hypothetical protein